VSKITNDGLTLSGTGCFIAVLICNGGRQRVNTRGWNCCSWAHGRWMSDTRRLGQWLTLLTLNSTSPELYSLPPVNSLQQLSLVTYYLLYISTFVRFYNVRHRMYKCVCAIAWCTSARPSDMQLRRRPDVHYRFQNFLPLLVHNNSVIADRPSGSSCRLSVPHIFF